MQVEGIACSFPAGPMRAWVGRRLKFPVSPHRLDRRRNFSRHLVTAHSPIADILGGALY